MVSKQWILPNNLILDGNSLSKPIGNYVTKIVYDQAFKVGVVRNLVSTLDVGFWTNMALPIQTRFSVFNKVYLVNHLCGVVDYSCKWLVFKYSYRCKGPQNAFGFT